MGGVSGSFWQETQKNWIMRDYSWLWFWVLSQSVIGHLDMEILVAIVVVQKLHRSSYLWQWWRTCLWFIHGTYGMFCGPKTVLGLQERPLIEQIAYALNCLWLTTSWYCCSPIYCPVPWVNSVHLYRLRWFYESSPLWRSTNSPSSLISLLEIKRPLTLNPVAHFDCRSRVFVVTFGPRT
jgi:hypothetical protein